MLAEGLANISYIDINPDSVKTNIVFIKLTEDAPIGYEELVEKLKQSGVYVSRYGAAALRVVTHYWVGEKEVEVLLKGIQTALNDTNRV